MDQSLDDARIVRRCLDGDGAAFAALVDRYQGVLYNVAHRMLGNEEDARDAAQNAVIKAYEKLATYDAERRLFSWLYRILTNECPRHGDGPRGRARAARRRRSRRQ
ncbi:MAG: sigma-70 family RNA polymerase sigma factor, partial [Acidobacteriota bacterium]